MKGESLTPGKTLFYLTCTTSITYGYMYHVFLFIDWEKGKEITKEKHKSK